MENKTDNELIAEFMGAEIVEKTNGMFKRNERHFSFPISHKMNVVLPEELKYDTSWDWLMPVVEKIEKYGCIVEIFMALTYGCRITTVHGPIMSFINDNNGGLPGITGVYKSVVEFIKWYNNHGKQ